MFLPTISLALMRSRQHSISRFSSIVEGKDSFAPPFSRGSCSVVSSEPMRRETVLRCEQHEFRMRNALRCVDLTVS
jgi:hypothetical protein